MKIVMIGQKGIPAKFGGVERHVEELSRRLVEFGNEVIVYSRPWYSKRRKSFNGVRLIPLPSIFTKHLDTISHTFISTLHALLFIKPDIIHYHGVGPALISWLPRILNPFTKVVITFHCIDRSHDKWGLIARWMLHLGEWAACTFAHKTISVSETLKRYCHEIYGKETEYIPNGFTTFQTKEQKILKKLGLKPKNYLLFVGRLIPFKRLDLLIDAYYLLPPKKRLTLVVSGSGFFTDQYVSKLVEKAKGLPIKFIGNQTGKDLSALYRGALALIQPSKIEGMPMVVLEAASLGVPVIASDIPVHREILKNFGTYFPSASVKHLAKQIAGLQENKELINQKARELQKSVRKNYSWSHISQVVFDLYQETLANKKVTSVQKTSIAH